MMGFVIAIVSGILMSIQGIFNTKVTKTAGMWVSNGWVQLTALVVCVFAWFMTGRQPIGQLLRVEPKYMLLGGVIGAGITWTVIKSVGTLGPAKAVMLIVVAQLLTSYMIEVFGIFGVEKTPFSWRKGIGLLIALFGVVLFQWE